MCSRKATCCKWAAGVRQLVSQDWGRFDSLALQQGFNCICFVLCSGSGIRAVRSQGKLVAARVGRKRFDCSQAAHDKSWVSSAGCGAHHAVGSVLGPSRPPASLLSTCLHCVSPLLHEVLACPCVIRKVQRNQCGATSCGFELLSCSSRNGISKKGQ